MFRASILLRSDPDIIMVGEIRDTETARLAVHAALTGHLVLTTPHTTSAAGTVIRLLDMGIEPFLLASALTGVISQRLVRSLCTNCRETYVLSGTARQSLGLGGEPGRTTAAPAVISVAVPVIRRIAVQR